jgi:hypothetical protein
LVGDYSRGSELNHDPKTHLFILATAAITSVAFAVSVMNVLAVVLSHVMH